MELFEVHITTADDSIHDFCLKNNGIKTIAVQLLRPDKSVLRTEHMTSQTYRFESYDNCLKEVLRITEEIKKECPVIRVKIESVYYAHYSKQSLYIETHFDSTEMKFPTSKNKNKSNLLATDRTKNKDQYYFFMKKYLANEIELCLYDTFEDEDLDWFNEYPEW